MIIGPTLSTNKRYKEMISSNGAGDAISGHVSISSWAYLCVVSIVELEFTWPFQFAFVTDSSRTSKNCFIRSLTRLSWHFCVAKCHRKWKTNNCWLHQVVTEALLWMKTVGGTGGGLDPLTFWSDRLFLRLNKFILAGLGSVCCFRNWGSASASNPLVWTSTFRFSWTSSTSALD